MGVVGEASDASNHPDHLEIVNVSAAMSPQRPLQSWFTNNGVRYSKWSSRSTTTKPGSPYPHQLAIHRLATRQRQDLLTVRGGPIPLGQLVRIFRTILQSLMRLLR